MSDYNRSGKTAGRRLLILTAILLLLPTTSFSMKTRFYLCIGSFRDIATLKKYYDPLVASKTPVIVSKNYDKGKPFYHLLYGRYYPTDGKARGSITQIRSLLANRSRLPLNDIWVFDKYINPFDPYSTGGSRTISGITEPDEYVYYNKTATYQTTVINRKGGGDESIDTSHSDTGDFEALQIIPELSDKPASTPVIILFNRKILLPSIIGHAGISSDGKQVQCYLRVIPYHEDRAAFCFTPIQGEWPNGDISLVIDKSLQSVSGEYLSKPVSISFKITKTDEIHSDYYDFENEDKSKYSIIGDGSSLTEIKDIVKAYSGNGFVCISTGKRLFSNSESIGGKSSFLKFSMPKLNGITFAYNLMSSEFNEFTGSPMGDISFIVVWGRNYQKVDIVTSVNRIGGDNTQLPYKRFASLPEMGDSYAGQSGWKVFEKNEWKYSGPVNTVILISNIKESAYNSVLLIDNIKAVK